MGCGALSSLPHAAMCPENAVGGGEHTDKGAFLNSFGRRLSSFGQPWMAVSFHLGIPGFLLRESLVETPSVLKPGDESSNYNHHEESSCSLHRTFSHPCCLVSYPFCSPHGQLPRCPPAYCASAWKSENLGQFIQVESVILLS